MRIALVGKYVNQFNEATLPKLLHFLYAHTYEVYASDGWYDQVRAMVPASKKLERFTYEDVPGIGLDYFLSIGGDGTILNTVSYVGNTGVPIIGINTGRLGFLSALPVENMEAVLSGIFAGAHDVDERALIRLDTENNLFGKLNFALNEVAIHRKDSSAMITVHAYLNGVFLNSYWADGLIISTPTGSTAYSLSCGGPIVMPRSGNFLITPISPHNLNVRPVVISDKDILTLNVEGRSKQYLVALDSRVMDLSSSLELQVRREDFTIKLVRPKGSDFLTTLRQKLMWGIDKRN